MDKEQSYLLEKNEKVLVGPNGQIALKGGFKIEAPKIPAAGITEERVREIVQEEIQAAIENDDGLLRKHLYWSPSA